MVHRLREQVPGMGQGVLDHQYTSYVDARVAERYRPRPYDGGWCCSAPRNRTR